MPAKRIVSKSTGKRGVSLSRVPGSGPRRWNVRFNGRPDNAGIPRGLPENTVVEESDLLELPDDDALANADATMLENMLIMEQDQRDTLRASMLLIRDDPDSTDHEKHEAIRNLTQLDVADGA